MRAGRTRWTSLTWRTSLTWLICTCGAGFWTWSATAGQERGQERGAAANPTPSPAIKPAAGRDLSKLSLLQRHFYLSGQRGAEWLQRVNGQDGRFLYGYIPALKVPLDGDDYLCQAQAAWALARAARLYGDERAAAAAAVARQAILTLLLETTMDSQGCRHTVLPSSLVNRLAAAGLLVAAIHELPSPAKDLLDQADQLCHYIRLQQQADGALRWQDGDDKAALATPVPPAEADARYVYPGLALYGLVRSQHLRPQPWKIEVVQKARGHYLAAWKQDKHPAFVPWQSAAYAEAFVLTRDPAFAVAVYELNDWLIPLQYQSADPRRAKWQGGFMGWHGGKATTTAPTIASAALAHSLADACRTARQAGDAQRLKSYRPALDTALGFVTTLQYTDANARHFADWYREGLAGAFHASPQDGNLRLDHTAEAVAALTHSLEHVPEP